MLFSPFCLNLKKKKNLKDFRKDALRFLFPRNKVTREVVPAEVRDGGCMKFIVLFPPFLNAAGMLKRERARAQVLLLLVETDVPRSHFVN